MTPAFKFVKPWNRSQKCVIEINGVCYKIIGGVIIPPFDGKGWYRAIDANHREVALKKRFLTMIRFLDKHSKKEGDTTSST